MGNDIIRPAANVPWPSEPVLDAPDASTRSFLLRAGAFGAAMLLPAAATARSGLAQSVNQGGQPLSVLFPDLGAPYRGIFEDMVAGIEAQVRQPVRAWPVSSSQDLAELAAALKRNGTRVIVALGRQGLKAAAVTDSAIEVVVGGVSSVPGGERQFGICLTPDPALLFAQLKKLLPSTRRVVVVHDPQHNGWLMRLARESAQAQGLELLAFEARDLASAARLYESTFASAQRGRDAVWLPIDPTTVDEATILPMVLREAWNRHVAVFSSSLRHVSKGALFSLYPDNLELGRSLGRLAGTLLAGQTPPRGVTPLRDVHAALNTRTASHLALSIDTRMQRAFRTIFPPA